MTGIKSLKALFFLLSSSILFLWFAYGDETAPGSAANLVIRLDTQQASFKLGDRIDIKIVNVSSAPASYSSGPRCALFFERKTREAWVRQALCFNCYDEIGGGPCKQETIPPGESISWSTLIGDGAASVGKVPAGFYRAGFRFDGGVTHSKEFTIGSPGPVPPADRGKKQRRPPLEDVWPEYDAVTSEKERERLLKCDKVPKSPPTTTFESLRIRILPTMGRVDDESLRGYVESRVMDGTITEKQKARFWRIVGLRSRVMNPASRGAAQITRAIYETLACFGIDTPAHPGTLPIAGKVSSEPLALARKYASDHQVSLYTYHLKNIDNLDGYFAPILVSEQDDILITGSKSEGPRSNPVVIKLSPSGRFLWERVLKKTGFRNYEGGSIAQTPDGGYVAFVLSYASRGAATRLVKLDPSGKIVWDHHFRGRGHKDPFADVLKALPNGHISLRGHVYLVKGSLSRWAAEIDLNGKVVFDKSGEEVPQNLE